MLRTTLFASVGALAACSSPTPTADQSGAAAPLPVLAAPTADALAAKQVVQRYFDLLRTGDYRQAWGLWSDSPTTSVGGLSAFVAASKAQGRLEGRAGDPSIIRDNAGMRYVLIESSARVTTPSGKISERTGVVMLKRPVDKDGSWRIWGVDVRPRHCRKGQVARGLGCVAV